MYIVIVGAGNIGSPLIEIATVGGNEVVVIERDEEKVERAADTYDCLVIDDGATVKETLLDAGIDRADALISTTDQDATNIMVCLLGQEFDVPAIVSVVHNPEHMPRRRRTRSGPAKQCMQHPAAVHRERREVVADGELEVRHRELAEHERRGRRGPRRTRPTSPRASHRVVVESASTSATLVPVASPRRGNQTAGAASTISGRLHAVPNGSSVFGQPKISFASEKI